MCSKQLIMSCGMQGENTHLFWAWFVPKAFRSTQDTQETLSMFHSGVKLTEWTIGKGVEWG